MDINTLTQLISGVGFPIAMAIAMFYYLNKERESHENEINRVTEVLNANTVALVELRAAIDHLKE